MRHKVVKGKRYYQLVRNYREEGKHRQEVICHLGVHDSLDSAIEEEKLVAAHKVARYKKAASNWHEQAAIARRYVWSSTGQGVLPEQEARSGWQEWRRRTETEPLDEEDEYERMLLFWSLEHHETKNRAAHYETLANRRPARLNKLLKIRQNYYLQKHPHSGS